MSLSITAGMVLLLQRRKMIGKFFDHCQSLFKFCRQLLLSENGMSHRLTCHHKIYMRFSEGGDIFQKKSVQVKVIEFCKQQSKNFLSHFPTL